MAKKQTCDRCGSPLKYTECHACDGKGYYRELLIFKTDCEACSGSGRVLRCPNEYDHILEDLKLSSDYSARSLYRGFQKSTSPKLNPRLNPHFTGNKPSQPQVPPPWHPSYPNPWHPMHPRNARNQPFNPQNPNSINNPMNPRNPHHPLNPNNPINKGPFKK